MHFKLGLNNKDAPTYTQRIQGHRITIDTLQRTASCSSFPSQLLPQCACSSPAFVTETQTPSPGFLPLAVFAMLSGQMFLALLLIVASAQARTLQGGWASASAYASASGEQAVWDEVHMQPLEHESR